MSDILTSILTGKYEPDTNELISLFKGLAMVPGPVFEGLIKALDADMVAKISEWASVFVSKINDIEAIRNKPDDSAGEAVYSDDFMSTMNRVRFTGQKIEWKDLVEAHNVTTKALKSGNYIAGIKMGITLAGMMA